MSNINLSLCRKGVKSKCFKDELQVSQQQNEGNNKEQDKSNNN